MANTNFEVIQWEEKSFHFEAKLLEIRAFYLDCDFAANWHAANRSFDTKLLIKSYRSVIRHCDFPDFYGKDFSPSLELQNCGVASLRLRKCG